jgi:hypothetical protein
VTHQITLVAPTAHWATLVCATIPIDCRDRYPRGAPKETRRLRYVRQFHRHRLRSWGADTGLWFSGLILMHFDPAARRRAREAAPRREASA